jgi:hypothetical protein
MPLITGISPASTACFNFFNPTLVRRAASGNVSIMPASRRSLWHSR